MLIITHKKGRKDKKKNICMMKKRGMLKRMLYRFRRTMYEASNFNGS